MSRNINGSQNGKYFRYGFDKIPQWFYSFLELSDAKVIRSGKYLAEIAPRVLCPTCAKRGYAEDMENIYLGDCVVYSNDELATYSPAKFDKKFIPLPRRAS